MLRDLLIGTCLGGIGVALVWHLYPGFWKEPQVTAEELAWQRRQALQQEAQQHAARAAALAAVQALPAPGPCDLEPLVPPAGAHDGHAVVQHPFPAGPRARAKVFLRAAEAATAQGRSRDAEVALIASCRENDQASTRPTVPLARVLGMLGTQYVTAAEQSPALREQLLARARHVLSLSAQTYAQALGPHASASRQARERLAALEQDLVAADMPQARQAPAGDDRAQPKPQRPQTHAAGAPAGAAAVRGRSPQPRPEEEAPGAEPARIRATVASDPELRQLASDLARLRAQAEAVSDDPAGLRRRAESARAQRDQCRDAGCLRDWYARRRAELLAEF